MSTTTHPFTPEEIMAYVDGELSADQRQSITAHVEQCAECSTLTTEQRGLSQQMTSWQVEVVPEKVNRRVKAASSGKYSSATR